MKSYTDTNSIRKPEQAILFVILACLWIAGFVILSIILAPNPDKEYQAIYHSISTASNIISYIKVLFRHADDWSWLTLFVSCTLITLLFNLNDLFLKKRFNKWFKESDLHYGFWYNGLLWAGRISTNTLLTSVQIVLIAFLLNVWVGKQRILSPADLTDKYEVILLGTSKYLKNTKSINVYYQQRIDAVVDLYKAGYVASVLISGDHQGKSYSEPHDMRQDLIDLGVPKELVELDLTGYRTFDSIKKLKSKSGHPLLFVSQSFHLERALFIASNTGINAYGFAASGGMTENMIKREALAKVKVILDIYILNTQAFGMPARARRNISLFDINDLILLIFVAVMVGLAGRLTRNLLVF